MYIFVYIYTKLRTMQQFKYTCVQFIGDLFRLQWFAFMFHIVKKSEFAHQNSRRKVIVTLFFFFFCLAFLKGKKTVDVISCIFFSTTLAFLAHCGCFHNRQQTTTGFFLFFANVLVIPHIRLFCKLAVTLVSLSVLFKSLERSFDI